MLRVLSITWRVLANLFALFVVLVLLNSPDSDFETIVVASLVLIDVNVVASFMWLTRQMAAGYVANLHRFVILLGYVDRERADGYSESLRELR